MPSFPAEILYIKAENKLCTVYTTTDSFVTRASLKDVELHSPLFALIHRTYLINVRYTQEIYRDQVRLTNGIELPVGKER